MARTISKVRTCVVGGAGFLGSHLVNYLIEQRDCPVLVVDNLCSGRREFVHKNAQFVHHDITQSENFLYQLFKQHSIEYVFNYAAQPYIPVSFERPLFTFMTNAVGALQVINAAQNAGVKGILQISSAELYGGEHYGSPINDGFEPKMDEDFPVTPHSTYGAAKAAIDYLVQCRWKEAQTPAIALRQFNCVGERETHPYVIPEIISQFHQWRGCGAATISLGNDTTRDFLYAGDQARMAVQLLENGRLGEVYNLGSEECIQIYDLARMIGSLMYSTDAGKIKIVEDPSRKRPWEIWHLRSDNTKIYEFVDKPTVILPRALELTIGDFHKRGSRWPWQS